jgi:hypothetical protein
MAHAANRENRRIIAGLVQRVPELEAAPEPRELPQTASEEPPGTRPSRKKPSALGGSGGGCLGGDEKLSGTLVVLSAEAPADIIGDIGQYHRRDMEAIVERRSWLYKRFFGS